MTQKTKNQHYIPKCILERFTNKDNRIFEALVNEKKVFTNNPRNAMSKRFMYEHDAFDTNLIENKLAEFEGDLNKQTQTIENAIHNMGEKECFEYLNDNMQSYLVLALLMYYRSGALFEEFEFSEIEKTTSVFEMLNKIQDFEYLNSLAQSILNEYKFAIIKSNSCFLISDQYISTAALRIKSQFANCSNRQIGMRDTLLLIPISSTYYLVYYDSSIIFLKENMINVLNYENELKINNVIVNNSYKKVAGSNVETINLCIQSYISSSPVGMLLKYEGGIKEGYTLKKEVFLFEKEKNDWIFLRSNKWMNMKNTKRNDPCPCGSGKKHKVCCYNQYQSIKKILVDMYYNKDRIEYKISNKSVVEKNICEFNPTDVKKPLKNLMKKVGF